MATDQTFQELSPHIVHTEGHGCEGNSLPWSLHVVLHGPDLSCRKTESGRPCREPTSATECHRELTPHHTWASPWVPTSYFTQGLGEAAPCERQGF